MRHEEEIKTILEQVIPWAEEDRVALAYEILRDMRKQTRQPAPRHTAEEAWGLAKSDLPAPDDVTVANGSKNAAC